MTNGKEDQFSYKGESKTLLEWCGGYRGKYNGVSYATIYKRIYHRGYTFEQAIKQGRINRRLYWFNGRSYTLAQLARTQLAKQNKHTQQRLLRRLHMGWSVERALRLPNNPDTANEDDYWGMVCARCGVNRAEHPKCDICEILIHEELYGCENRDCTRAHTYTNNGTRCLECVRKYGEN